MTKVDLTVGGHIVIIDADEPLDIVAAKALELWRAIDRADITKSISTTGFSTERVGTDTYATDVAAF